MRRAEGTTVEEGTTRNMEWKLIPAVIEKIYPKVGTKIIFPIPVKLNVNDYLITAVRDLSGKVWITRPRP